MKRFYSKAPLAGLAVALLVGFAVFACTSAANLNYSTLQSIDGPVTARQIEALRLSSALNAVSVGILVGTFFFALVTYFSRRSSALSETESQP